MRCRQWNGSMMDDEEEDVDKRCSALREAPIMDCVIATGTESLQP